MPDTRLKSKEDNDKKKMLKCDGKIGLIGRSSVGKTVYFAALYKILIDCEYEIKFYDTPTFNYVSKQLNTLISQAWPIRSININDLVIKVTKRKDSFIRLIDLPGEVFHVDRHSKIEKEDIERFNKSSDVIIFFLEHNFDLIYKINKSYKSTLKWYKNNKNSIDNPKNLYAEQENIKKLDLIPEDCETLKKSVDYDDFELNFKNAIYHKCLRFLRKNQLNTSIIEGKIQLQELYDKLIDFVKEDNKSNYSDFIYAEYKKESTLKNTDHNDQLGRVIDKKQKLAIVITKSDLFKEYSNDKSNEDNKMPLLLIPSELEYLKYIKKDINEKYKLFKDEIIIYWEKKSKWDRVIKELFENNKNLFNQLLEKNIDFQIFFVSAIGNKVDYNEKMEIIPPKEIEPQGVIEPIEWCYHKIIEKLKTRLSVKITFIMTILALLTFFTSKAIEKNYELFTIDSLNTYEEQSLSKNSILKMNYYNYFYIKKTKKIFDDFCNKDDFRYYNLKESKKIKQHDEELAQQSKEIKSYISKISKESKIFNILNSIYNTINNEYLFMNIVYQYLELKKNLPRLVGNKDELKSLISQIDFIIKNSENESAINQFAIQFKDINKKLNSFISKGIQIKFEYINFNQKKVVVKDISSQYEIKSGDLIHWLPDTVLEIACGNDRYKINSLKQLYGTRIEQGDISIDAQPTIHNYRKVMEKNIIIDNNKIIKWYYDMKVRNKCQ